MDDKQKRLIKVWKDHSCDGKDYYVRFISLWISFNAFCYARYSKDAIKYRANLTGNNDFNFIAQSTDNIKGSFILRDGECNLNITEPDKIKINISKGYRESSIFKKFTIDFKPSYDELINQPKFEKSLKIFQQALKKDQKYYVINMARIESFNSNSDYDEMIRKEIIYPFDNYRNLNQLKNVLYQVRCNVFHGEKIPGELNDDRLVKAAYPILYMIMESLLKK